MRTRAAVEGEMMSVRADMAAAAAEHDEISVDLDHVRLDELLTEWQAIPQQRRR